MNAAAIVQTIANAVNAVGLPADAAGRDQILEAPVDVAGPLLPNHYVTYQLMDAKPERLGRKLSVSGQDGDERILRTAFDKLVQPVRLSIHGPTGQWCEDFTHSLHRSLPRTAADEHNNLMRIQAETVKLGGKGTKTVDVSIGAGHSRALHLRFSGLVTRDESTPWITDATIDPVWGSKEEDDG